MILEHQIPVCIPQISRVHQDKPVVDIVEDTYALFRNGSKESLRDLGKGPGRQGPTEGQDSVLMYSALEHKL